MSLGHKVQSTRSDADFGLKSPPGNSSGTRVTADPRSEITRSSIGEGNPDAGCCIKGPEEHRLLQEVRNVQVIRAPGGVIRLHDRRQVHIETGISGNIIAPSVSRMLRPSAVARSRCHGLRSRG